MPGTWETTLNGVKYRTGAGVTGDGGDALSDNMILLDEILTHAARKDEANTFDDSQSIEGDVTTLGEGKSIGGLLAAGSNYGYRIRLHNTSSPMRMTVDRKLHGTWYLDQFYVNIETGEVSTATVMTVNGATATAGHAFTVLGPIRQYSNSGSNNIMQMWGGIAYDGSTGPLQLWQNGYGAYFKLSQAAGEIGIHGWSGTGLWVANNSNVGIGAAPSRKLDVAGDAESNNLYASDGSFEISTSGIRTMDKFQATASGVYDERAWTVESNEYNLSGSTSYGLFSFTLLEYVVGVLEVDFFWQEQATAANCGRLKKTYMIHYTSAGFTSQEIASEAYDASGGSWSPVLSLEDLSGGSFSITCYTPDTNPFVGGCTVKYKYINQSAGFSGVY